MKKSLVVTLALVFVLGIAGTAFAANPFSDVPANHWAYAAVSKLAQEGIVSGYGDGRFAGNRTITRYEMAQIVAKALANGGGSAAAKAQLQKLAAEYADELDSLGVRVAKLEKNADNVKITGEARFAHYAYDKDGSGDNSKLRTRIHINGQINNKWKYVGMLESNNDLKQNGSNTESIALRRAAVFGKIGAVDVQAGRFQHKTLYGVAMDAADADGLVLGYQAGDFKITAFATRPDFKNNALRGNGGNDGGTPPKPYSNNQVFGATVGVDMGKFDFQGAYYHTDPSIKAATDVGSSNIFELAVGYKFTKEFKVWAEYLRGSEEIADGGKDGWAAGLNWSNLNKNKPGTFNVRAIYYDVPAAAVINMTSELEFHDKRSGVTGSKFDGYEGYNIGATYMVAKNIDINVDYFDFEGQKKANGDNSLLWSYVRFYF